MTRRQGDGETRSKAESLLVTLSPCHSLAALGLIWLRSRFLTSKRRPCLNTNTNPNGKKLPARYIEAAQIANEGVRLGNWDLETTVSDFIPF